MWLKWLLIGCYAMSVVWTIANIGEPRKTITKTDAVVALVLNGLMTWGLLVYWR